MDQHNESQRKARNAIQRARVVDVDLSDPAAPRVRVAVGDPDIDGEGQTSDWLPWKAPRAGRLRAFSAPVVGEQVELACPVGDLSQGSISGSFFCEDYPAPGVSASEHVFQFSDGARLAYDEADHTLTVALPAGGTITMSAPALVQIRTKTATVQADELVTIDAPQTVCKGALTVEGPLAFLSGATGEGGEGGEGGSTFRVKGKAEFTSDVVAAGVSLVRHPHDAQGEFARTSPAIAEAA